MWPVIDQIEILMTFVKIYMIIPEFRFLRNLKILNYKDYNILMLK